MKEITEEKALDARNWQSEKMEFIIQIDGRYFVGTEEEWKRSLEAVKPEQVDPKYVRLKK